MRVAVLLGVIVVLAVAVAGLSWRLQVVSDELGDYRRALELSSAITKVDIIQASGYYYGGAFYCVWLDGRGAEEIGQTVVHEQCHGLVHYDRDHFCG